MVMENRYDKYKDSGIAWIGEIPEHWEVKRLKNVCSTNSASLSDNTSKEFEFDYVDIGSVTFELGIHKTEKYTFQNAPSRARKIARLGDIIVSTVRTYLRAIDIINSEEKEKYIYSTGFAILSPLKNTLSEFMIYICRSEYFTNQVSIYSTGINYPSINDTALKMINIVMPYLSEQQSIANYLDQKCSEIDELITLQEEMITKLQSYKQSVITEAVTKGLDKNVHLKDSGIEWIGEIPEHWEVKRLKNVCSTNNASLSDKTSKEFEFDYVDIGSVSFELGIHKTERYTFQNAPSRARKIARLGDIIVSTVRTYLRAIDIINSEEKEKYIYSTGFAILSPLKNILSEFMIYICRSEYFTNLVSIYSTGINYPSINDTALKMINIVIPPIHEQQSIANYLDQKCSEIDELISIKQQKIEKLKDYKKSLIFECVTGKRKV